MNLFYAQSTDCCHLKIVVLTPHGTLVEDKGKFNMECTLTMGRKVKYNIIRVFGYSCGTNHIIYCRVRLL